MTPEFTTALALWNRAIEVMQDASALHVAEAARIKVPFNAAERTFDRAGRAFGAAYDLEHPQKD